MRYSLLSAILVMVCLVAGCSGQGSDPVQVTGLSDRTLASGGEQEQGGHPFDGAPAFDFADHYYLANGINPPDIVDRLVGQDDRSMADTSPHADYAAVQLLEVTGGFDHKGQVLFYTVNGKIMPSTFTSDAAGDRALATANAFRAFIFPKAAGNPLGPPPPNRRQDNLFDTRNGYRSNNPLGNWLLTFVSYTSEALTTEDGQAELAKLAEKNGLDLDGTPVIKTVSDLEHLEKNGLVKFRTRAQDGSQGFPWVI